MSHATVQPTPSRRLLQRETYGSTGGDLQGVFDAALKSVRHYYAPVTLSRQAEALGVLFEELAREWIADTRFESSLTSIVTHPAYRAIISLGGGVLPLILRALETKPNHWFGALRSITGADPVRPEDRGDMRAMTNAWLRWARENSLSW